MVGPSRLDNPIPEDNAEKIVKNRYAIGRLLASLASPPRMVVNFDCLIYCAPSVLWSSDVSILAAFFFVIVA